MLVFNEWYRKELKNILPDIIEHWKKKIDVKVDFCDIKQMKIKWGSCSIEKKRIHCLEYILIHEIIHLLERNHNDRFKNYMDNYLVVGQMCVSV